LGDRKGILPVKLAPAIPKEYLRDPALHGIISGKIGWLNKN